MTFYERLTSICEQHHTTPTAIVKTLNMSSSNVTTWKSGKIPNGENLSKLSDYFDVSVDYLLGRTDTPETDSLKKPLSIAEEFRQAEKNTVQIAAYGRKAATFDKKTNTQEQVNKPAEYELSENEQEFLRIYRQLPPKDKNKLMTEVYKFDKDI